jgi:LPXTG-motif cell wall-anchored protein
MTRVLSVAVLVMALLVVVALPALADAHVYPPTEPPAEEVLPRPPVERVEPVVVTRPAPAAEAPRLAVTGGDSVLIAALGAGLVLIGGGLVYASRRRRLALEG